jgi:hypothetical protein
MRDARCEIGEPASTVGAESAFEPRPEEYGRTSPEVRHRTQLRRLTVRKGQEAGETSLAWMNGGLLAKASHVVPGHGAFVRLAGLTPGSLRQASSDRRKAKAGVINPGA